jgi:hypothetical protein
MALTTLEPIITSATSSVPDTDGGSMLAALVLTLYAGQVSRKALRKLKRQAMVSFFKDRVRSFFSPKAISERTLLYILLGVAILILVFVSWPVAIALLLLGILLVLLMK